MTKKPTQMSIAGINLLESLEGKEWRVYKDQAGLQTIGIGHLIKSPDANLIKVVGINRAGNLNELALSDAEIEELLFYDIAPINLDLGEYNIQTTNVLDAITLFIFNVGRYAFKTSTAAKYLRMGKPVEQIALQILRWNKVKGKGGKLIISNGLSKRRLLEGAILMNDINWAVKMHKEYNKKIDMEEVKLLYTNYMHDIKLFGKY